MRAVEALQRSLIAEIYDHPIGVSQLPGGRKTGDLSDSILERAKDQGDESGGYLLGDTVNQRFQELWDGENRPGRK